MFLNKHNMGNFWNTTIWGIGAELLKNILEYGEFPKREISAVEYVKATIWGIPHIEARMRKSVCIRKVVWKKGLGKKKKKGELTYSWQIKPFWTSHYWNPVLCMNILSTYVLYSSK